MNHLKMGLVAHDTKMKIMSYGAMIVAECLVMSVPIVIILTAGIVILQIYPSTMSKSVLLKQRKE